MASLAPKPFSPGSLRIRPFGLSNAFALESPARRQIATDNLSCIWSTGAGWSTYSLRRQAGAIVFSVKVCWLDHSPCQSCEIAASAAAVSVEAGGKAVESRLSKRGENSVVDFGKTLHMDPTQEIHITLRG
jgi:hypothetical protein